MIKAGKGSLPQRPKEEENSRETSFMRKAVEITVKINGRTEQKKAPELTRGLIFQEMIP